jgi:hypothetical protein
MRRTHLTSAVLAAALGFGTVGSTARAASTTLALAPITGATSVNLTTEFRPSETGGEYDGTLQLHVSRDGIVSGFYRPSDGSFVPVEGGLDGEKLWLDFGWRGRVHITGTFDGRSLDGGAFFDRQPWTFTGKTAG